MRIEWTPEIEARFQARMSRQTEGACKIAAFLCLVFFPSFTAIDWFAQNAHVGILNRIRYSAVFCFLLIFLWIRKKKHPWNPYGWSFLLMSIAAFDITCMTLALDGYRSPYYAGINLVLLGAALLFPWGATRMGLMVGWICALYFVPVLWQANFQIDDVPAFVNNTAFLISTASVATTAAFFAQRLRRDNFIQEMTSDGVNQALEMRDEFISIASHELKTPITVLKLQNDLLARSLSRLPVEKDTQDSFQRHLSRSNGQLVSLIRLINDMLDLSRITAGKMEFHPDHVVVGDIIREVTERLHESLTEHRIELVLELEEDVIGYVDKLRIEQVFMNLITNAVKYAPGKPLRISLREENDRAILEVQDHGPGIPEPLKIKVFDRFERGNSNHNIGGLGLGLYIARQIVWGMGGEISIENKPGFGACFRIVLPLRG
jgi:signal transduction histidine kinase